MFRECYKDKNIFWAAALQTDQKAKNAFCHSVRVASALNGPITTVCTANAYIPYVPVPFTAYAAIPNEPKTGKSKD